MDKRKEKRIKKRLMTNISEHSAITCDISAEGLQITMSTNPKTVLVDIKIDLGKENFSLKGKVKWIRRNPVKKMSTIGISLIDIPGNYKKKLYELFPVLATDNETKIEIDEIDEINSLFGI